MAICAPKLSQRYMTGQGRLVPTFVINFALDLESSGTRHIFGISSIRQDVLTTPLSGHTGRLPFCPRCYSTTSRIPTADSPKSKRFSRVSQAPRVVDRCKRRLTRFSNYRCSRKGPTLCGFSETCTVEGTTVTLHLQSTGHRVRPDDMRQILDKGQEMIESKFFEDQRQDRMLVPDEVPWTVQVGGLVMRAQEDGWSWKLLNITIIGVRECAFKKGIFEEIFVNSIQDPRAMNPSGGRFFNIVERSRPSPPPRNTIGAAAPRPLPPGLHRYVDSSTHTRLLYELADPVDGNAMRDIYDQASQDVMSRIQTQGDRVLQPQELPWMYQSNGLELTAQYEGWSLGLLNRTIGAMKKCTFEQNMFREVIVYDVAGDNVPPGQRYLDLRKLSRFI